MALHVLDVGEGAKYSRYSPPWYYVLAGDRCPIVSSPAALHLKGEVHTPLSITQSPWQFKPHIPFQSLPPGFPLGTLGTCQTEQQVASQHMRVLPDSESLSKWSLYM